VLGFSSGNFYRFIDSSNNTIPDSAVIGYNYFDTGYGKKNATLIISPKVKAKVLSLHIWKFIIRLVSTLVAIN
jgi:hypothetical protein